MAEAPRKEKEAEQWACIPHKNLLNQSFLEQLESLQILEQLAPLAREHLPLDIIEILECLEKADNIPFNQLNTLAENCADHYYSKVIKTLILLIKWQSADRQTLLANTACALKFLEEYRDRQLWTVLHKYHNFPDHFEALKTSLETDFKHLKLATSKNVENIQTSLAV